MSGRLVKIDAEIAIAERDWYDAHERRAELSLRSRDADNITYHDSRGMSRSRLEQIYGRALVYAVLGPSDRMA